MINTGPFNLIKNEPMDIIIAYVVGRGIDHLNSIDRAREITRYVHEEYERNFSTLVSVEDKQEELPAQFYLSQNYPNPFNPTTKIKFSIPSPTSPLSKGGMQGGLTNVSLIVYDILGRKVTTLVDEPKAPGTYEITFDASRLASGVYLYRLTSGSFSQTKKM
ncbi:MAG TPA: T9SS type A sorting domain-containing protein, partial [Ignavibacteria bacterium]|nr:T9SS type A sorting domain-containing protein [Ignavibacteria bacterium]